MSTVLNEYMMMMMMIETAPLSHIVAEILRAKHLVTPNYH